MALTGKYEFRKSLWGKIVLQVEEEQKQKPFWSNSGASKRRWRDATLMDLAAPQIRFLMEFRLKPWARPVSPPAPPKVSEPQRTEVATPVRATR
jgi:hypothetical protein